MRPVHYLLIYIACMYLIAIINILQVVAWVVIPRFEPSIFVALCGTIMFVANAYVEHLISKNNIELEDLL